MQVLKVLKKVLHFGIFEKEVLKSLKFDAIAHQINSTSPDIISISESAGSFLLVLPTIVL